MFFLPHYSHSFQITVNPSGLLSFLPYQCHSFRIIAISNIFHPEYPPTPELRVQIRFFIADLKYLHYLPTIKFITKKPFPSIFTNAGIGPVSTISIFTSWQFYTFSAVRSHPTMITTKIDKMYLSKISMARYEWIPLFF